MTEQDWPACDDSEAMLRILRPKGSNRKFRLFTCACCRSRWAELPDDQSRKAVEVAERFADGLADSQELEQAHEAARSVATRFQSLARRSLEEARGKQRHFVKTAYSVAGLTQAAKMAAWHRPHVYPYPWTIDCGGGLYDGMALGLEADAYAAVFEGNCDLLREVFGNPFCPMPLDSAWLTPTVKQLAQAVYETRDFSSLPILADALEEAGCTSADILTHFRQSVVHVLGCWPLDFILGKE